MSRGEGVCRTLFLLATRRGGSRGDSLSALLEGGDSTHKHQQHKEDQAAIPRAVSSQMAPVPDCWGATTLGLPIGERGECEVACPQSQPLVQDAPGRVGGGERRFHLSVLLFSHTLGALLSLWGDQRPLE